MKKMFLLVVAAMVIPFVIAQAQAPYRLPYAVGMNGGNPGASQWFQLDLSVYPDGTITAPIILTNDVFGEGFCGTVRLELHDLRDNALLFAAESQGYCIGSKGLGGHENRVGPIAWTMHTSPEVAQRFMNHPSVYGVRSQYNADSWFFDGFKQAVILAAKLIPAS